MQRRVICGIHPVRRALLARAADVEALYLQEGIGAGRLGRLQDLLDRSPVPPVHCPAAELERLTGSGKHQGVVAVVADRGPLGEAEARELVSALERPLLLVLDGIQDPRNFGACLRTADAAGVDLVVTARNRNVALTPAASKVAAGAAESVQIAEVGNLARFMGHLQSCGVWSVGMDAGADQSLYELDLTTGIALVLGGEGEGLRRLTRERCDFLARLPMQGAVESLNVAVATGICLYEAVRQRGAGLPPGRGLR